MNHSMPGLPVHHQFPESTQTHVHWVGDAIQPSHSLSSPSPPVINLSQQQGLFQWVNSSHQVAKELAFQFQYQSFQWTARTDLLKMDWLDLLAVQGTLKSLLQHHSSKALILWHSAFFIVQLSHPYMTTGKTTALIRRTFVDKVVSLLFNMLSRLIINFLPRSKHILISTRETWVQSLGQEDPLEEGIATHSNILAWRICMDRGAWWAHCSSDATERLSAHIPLHNPIQLYKESPFLCLSLPGW